MLSYCTYVCIPDFYLGPGSHPYTSPTSFVTTSVCSAPSPFFLLPRESQSFPPQGLCTCCSCWSETLLPGLPQGWFLFIAQIHPPELLSPSSVLPSPACPANPQLQHLPCLSFKQTFILFDFLLSMISSSIFPGFRPDICIVYLLHDNVNSNINPESRK